MCIVDVGPAGQRQPTNRGGFELDQAHALIFDALESRLLDSLPLLALRVYASERERASARGRWPESMHRPGSFRASGGRFGPCFCSEPL